MVVPPIRIGTIIDLVARGVQTFFAGVHVDGGEVRLAVAQPGAVAKATFQATAGQKIFVQIVSSTLPDQCGAVRLLAPDAKLLGSGCINQGTGRIDAVVLPTTGQYAVDVDPSGDTIGETVVRLITATDQTSIMMAAPANGPRTAWHYPRPADTRSSSTPGTSAPGQ